MSGNILLKTFGQDLSGTEDNKICHFDWGAHSVNCVYIIFITGRCGSTWLSRLLKDSGICGDPDELFNETVMPRFNRTVKATNFRDYFSGLVTNFSQGGRFGFKIDGHRFQQLRQLINFNSLFPKSVTKIFWMTRRDLVSQGFSFAHAKASGHWHDFATQTEEQLRHIANITDALLWKEIISIIEKEKCMEAFFDENGIVPIKLDYEQMTTDAILTVMNVMMELDCLPDEIEAFVQNMENKTLRLQFENKYKILGQFCARYKPLVHNLGEHRSRFEVNDLRIKLQMDYNLTV